METLRFVILALIVSWMSCQCGAPLPGEDGGPEPEDAGQVDAGQLDAGLPPVDAGALAPDAGCFTCGAGCVDLLTDADNCGQCGFPCAGLDGCQPECIGGSCLQNGSVFISELMLNPPELQYVELFNDTAGTMNMAGWSLTDLGANTETLSGGTISPGGYALVVQSDDPDDNCGVENIGSGLPPLEFDAAEALILSSPGGCSVDFVNWGAFNAGDRIARQLEPGRDGSNNDAVSSANWCESEDASVAITCGNGADFFGTPNAPSSCP